MSGYASIESAINRVNNRLGSLSPNGTFQAVLVGAGTIPVSIGSMPTTTVQWSGQVVAVSNGTVNVNGTLPVSIPQPLETIDIAHNEVHEGYYFVTSKRVNGAGTVENFQFVVPAGGTVPHINFLIESTDFGIAELFANPTVTSNGSAMTIYNKNRNSSTPSLMSAYYGGTVTADGTLMVSHLWGNATGQGAGRATFGGAVRSNTEWILSAGKRYLLKVSGINAGTLVFTAEWYSHPV